MILEPRCLVIVVSPDESPRDELQSLLDDEELSLLNVATLAEARRRMREVKPGTSVVLFYEPFASTAELYLALSRIRAVYRQSRPVSERPDRPSVPA